MGELFLAGVGAASSRAGSPRCWPFCLGPARGFIQYASEGANANVSLFWVRFMPPPHAQPPGSNKSQRGRECCKETVPLQFLCDGREMRGGSAGCSQVPQHHKRHQRTPPKAWGNRERRGLLFSHPPSLLCQCCVCAQVPEAAMEPSTSTWQTGLLQRSALPLLCAKVLPSV